MAQTITLQPGESVTIVAAGATGPTPIPPQPARPHYTYFGCDTASITQTADHCDSVMMADWAYHQWGYQAVVDSMLGWFSQAKSLGLKVVVGCNFLLTDQNNNPLGSNARVTQFRQTLTDLGYADMVIALYPFDEPDMNPKLNDTILRDYLAQLRLGWPGPALAVIYGDHALEQGKWYAKDLYDWVGISQYSKDPLNHQPSINAHQMRILVPGGADGEGSGWRVNPAPWVQYAQVPDNRVAMMMPFLWVNYAYQGIGANGMAPLYRGAGKTITGKA